MIISVTRNGVTEITVTEITTTGLQSTSETRTGITDIAAVYDRTKKIHNCKSHSR